MTWMLWVKRSILTNQSLRRSTELAMSWLKLRKQYGKESRPTDGKVLGGNVEVGVSVPVLRYSQRVEA